jgi:glycosyltransferase involved in cell wall biosynthesis
MTSRARKICFIESAAIAVLDGSVRASATGGESVQHTLLARAFAKRGWDVSLISGDFGQENGAVIDGIQVWKTFARKEGVPVLRFIYPRLYRTWQALERADADVYFQSCAGMMTGLLAKFVARRDRKMIFRVAHDTDCVPGEELIRLGRDRRIYQYGLRRADLISAQSGTQARLLQDNYGLPSTEVDMAAEIPDDPDEAGRDIDVLWVNNFRAFKRPELLLDIARRMPEVSFTMIGGKMKNEEALYDDIQREALELDNVDFVGGVPYSEVNAYFERARLFLNTSDSEGFPNSFLQAWVRRVPVISYFDPDNLIADKGLGISVDTQDDFVEALSGLLGDDQGRQAAAQRGRQFVVDRYSPDAIAAQYERLIADRFGITTCNA